jgi:hypothetical protein
MMPAGDVAPWRFEGVGLPGRVPARSMAPLDRGAMRFDYAVLEHSALCPRRALAGHHPQTAQRVAKCLEATVDGWNADPTLF